MVRSKFFSGSQHTHDTQGCCDACIAKGRALAYAAQRANQVKCNCGVQAVTDWRGIPHCHRCYVRRLREERNSEMRGVVNGLLLAVAMIAMAAACSWFFNWLMEAK